MLRKRDSSARRRGFGVWLAALALTACGGGGSGGDRGEAPDPDGEPPVCKTSDAIPAASQCGRLFVGFSDIEGDFIRYRVDIVSLRLQRSDRTWIRVLADRNTVDLVEYRQLSELLTAATLSPGSYVGAEITLDYRDADIRVDVDGWARRARVLDAGGDEPGRVTLALEFDPLNRLRVVPGSPVLLQLDFKLAASHLVDTLLEPPLVELLPVVTAEADPERPQPFRLRGPLIAVAEREASYRIAVRPFNRRIGRFGGVDIRIDSDTEWEIDGVTLPSFTGLAALAELPAGTATLSFGTYDTGRNRFTVKQVFVGGSVPGETLDALRGHVLARDDNVLTLIGARLIRTDGTVVFDDKAKLLVTGATPVSVPGFPSRRLRGGDISVGQRITALGLWSGEEKSLDAGERRVRLLPTRLDAILNRRTQVELSVVALEFGGRDSGLFDFTGTGIEPTEDADPANYQVEIESLPAGAPLAGDSLSIGVPPVSKPLSILGFAAPFGSAPPDFGAIAIEDFTERGAQLRVSWIGKGSADPFLALDAGGLALKLNSAPLGREHHIRRGALLTDLLAPINIPRLLPTEERGLYALAEEGTVTLYSDFGDFATDLDRRLALGARVKLLHAEGGYRSGASVMSVTGLEVVLID